MCASAHLKTGSGRHCPVFRAGYPGQPGTFRHAPCRARSGFQARGSVWPGPVYLAARPKTGQASPSSGRVARLAISSCWRQDWHNSFACISALDGVLYSSRKSSIIIMNLQFCTNKGGDLCCSSDVLEAACEARSSIGRIGAMTKVRNINLNNLSKKYQ
jgi:hypothetical protein